MVTQTGRGRAPVSVQPAHHRQAGRGGGGARRCVCGPGDLGVLQRPGLAAPGGVGQAATPSPAGRTAPLELTFDVPRTWKRPRSTPSRAGTSAPGWSMWKRVLHDAPVGGPLPEGSPVQPGPMTGGAGGVPGAENNGGTVRLEDTEGSAAWPSPLWRGWRTTPGPCTSALTALPHAMPLSLFFDVAGQARLEDKVRFEAWNGSRFEPVRAVDLTRNLLHPGVMLLYLPKPLPACTLFGAQGYWLRPLPQLLSGQRRGLAPGGGHPLNTVEAVQRERAEEERFSVGAYEAGKDPAPAPQPGAGRPGLGGRGGLPGGVRRRGPGPGAPRPGGAGAGGPGDHPLLGAVGAAGSADPGRPRGAVLLSGPL